MFCFIIFIIKGSVSLPGPYVSGLIWAFLLLSAAVLGNTFVFVNADNSCLFSHSKNARCTFSEKQQWKIISFQDYKH